MLIRLYPGLTRTALRKGYSNALAFWYLARAVDGDGTGRVKLSEIRAACPWWNDDKWYRCVRSSNKYGMASTFTAKSCGSKTVRLVSLVKVAALLGVPHLGARAVMANVEVLAKSTTFRAIAFAAFHAGRSGHNENPISRKVLRELTGVARPTQLKYEKAQKVTKRRNHLELHLSPDHLTWAKDNIHPACFIGKAGTVCRPLPNSYTAPHDVTSRRPIRKRNSRLASLVPDTAGLLRAKAGKLFYDTDKAADRSRRAHGKNSGRGIPSAFEPDYNQIAIVHSGELSKWLLA